MIKVRNIYRTDSRPLNKMAG